MRKGKPPEVSMSDQGQRYEVSYARPSDGSRVVFGWADSLESARMAARALQFHPDRALPRVRDRSAGDVVK